MVAVSISSITRGRKKGKKVAIKIRKKSKRHQSCKVRENYHYMQMIAQVPNQGESSEKQVKLIRDFKRWFQDNV